jgi:Bacterial lectin
MVAPSPSGYSLRIVAGILRLDRRARSGGLVLGLVGAAGCSLLVSTSDLSNGASTSAPPSSEGGDDGSSREGDASSFVSSSSSGGTEAGAGASGSGSSSGASGASSSGAGTSSSNGSSSSSSGAGGGTVDAGACTPGQVECNSLTPQTCNLAGQWQSGTACSVACCNGTCIDTNTDPKNCGGCGNACGTGYRCGTGFTSFTGTQPSDWTVNGTAVYDSADLAAQLTDLNGGEAGSWVYNRAILCDPISIQFDFYIGGGSGADGMGLMLVTDGATALGPPSGALGMAGLSGFGVELDEWNNGECMDSSTNDIGIDSLVLCNENFPNTLAVNSSPGITIADGNWHTLVVRIASGAFTVTADGNSVFSNQAAGGWPSNPAYYLGFAGGTGGLTDYHRVRNVSVSFPTPSCY